MEFIFIFAMIFREVCFINFFEIMKIVRASGIHTLMHDEVFSVLFGNQGVAAMGAAQLYRRKSAFIGREPCIADLTQELPFGTVILIEKRLRSITAGTGTGVWNITL